MNLKITLFEVRFGLIFLTTSYFFLTIETFSYVSWNLRNNYTERIFLSFNKNNLILLDIYSRVS